MTSHTLTSTARPTTVGTSEGSCGSTADRITRSLLGYGVVAGPLYVAVSLAQALTREGFDLSRHQWSLLANGGPGWIQVVNLAVTGASFVAFASGLRRQLAGGRGGRWAPRLVTAFGVSLVVAAVFRADPALGFPAGTPDGPGEISWHGIVHFMAAGVGFACIGAACFVLARRYAAEHRTGRVIFARITGAGFLAGFAAVASGGGSTAANLAFVAAVLLVFSWLTTVAADRYRLVGTDR
jgi:hypothetical protein